MPEEKAAGLRTAAASRSDYTRNYTIPAATLLTRLSAEFSVIAGSVSHFAALRCLHGHHLRWRPGPGGQR